MLYSSVSPCYVSKLSKIHKKYLGFLLSLHVYWSNKTGSTFMFSNFFEVVGETIACHLAGGNTIFINLKRGIRTYFPCCWRPALHLHVQLAPSDHTISVRCCIAAGAREGTVLLSRAGVRETPKAQYTSHLPVAMLDCLLYPFSPHYTQYQFLQWPQTDFTAWIWQGAIAVRCCVLQAGDGNNGAKALHSAGRRGTASV